MTLLKTINTEIQENESLFESAHLADFFDENGSIVQESISSFIVGAKKLIDDLHIEGEAQASVDAPQSELARLERFASILAGLEYFRQKNVGADERVSLAKVLDDKNITAYVKKIGTEKAKEIFDEIKTHFFRGKIMRREGLDKIIEDIRKFYLSKKANVGAVLAVSTTETV